MMRKHINSLEQGVKKVELPFYCWQCITLQQKNRDIDLVIFDEKDMVTLLKFLILSLKTIDGKRDSAKYILASTIQNQLVENSKPNKKQI